MGLMVFWVLNFGSGKEFVAVGRMYAWLDGWIDRIDTWMRA